MSIIKGVIIYFASIDTSGFEMLLPNNTLLYFCDPPDSCYVQAPIVGNF